MCRLPGLPARTSLGHALNAFSSLVNLPIRLVPADVGFSLRRMMNLDRGRGHFSDLAALRDAHLSRQRSIAWGADPASSDRERDADRRTMPFGTSLGGSSLSGGRAA